MNAKEYLVAKIEQTRSRRRRAISLGIIVIVTMIVLVLARFVILETGVIQSYNGTKEDLKNHINQVTSLAASAYDLMGTFNDDNKDIDEYRELDNEVKKAYETNEKMQAMLQKFGSMNSGSIDEIKKYDAQVQQHITRLEKLTNNLQIKVDLTAFDVLVNALKTAITDGTRTVNSANGVLPASDTKELKDVTDEAVELVRADLSDEDKLKASTAMSDQIKQKTEQIRNLVQQVEEKITKKKASMASPTTSSSNSTSSSSSTTKKPSN